MVYCAILYLLSGASEYGVCVHFSSQYFRDGDYSGTLLDVEEQEIWSVPAHTHKHTHTLKGSDTVHYTWWMGGIDVHVSTDLTSSCTPHSRPLESVG